MSLKGKTHIYQGHGNEYRYDPSQIRMISDRALIKDLGDPDRQGLIIIPEAFRERGLDQFGIYRVGLVIAVGPGDRWVDVGYHADAGVIGRLIMEPCGWCAGKGAYFSIHDYENVTCKQCEGTGKVSGIMLPQCKPGDRVLFEKRREAEIYLNGERYVLCHAEQAVIAVLEDE